MRRVPLARLLDSASSGVIGALAVVTRQPGCHATASNTIKNNSVKRKYDERYRPI